MKAGSDFFWFVFVLFSWINCQAQKQSGQNGEKKI